MLVFLSWSGGVSNRVANALKSWLKTVFTDVNVWMSEQDIEAGTSWGTVLHEQLNRADFGILCMSRENLTVPWLLYEAGALAMSSKAGCVVPYLLGVEAENLPAPLSHLQSAQADKEGTWKIVKSINAIRADGPSEVEIRLSFEENWPALARNLGLDIRTRYVEDIPVIAPSPASLRDPEEGELLRENLGAHFRDGQKRVILDLGEAAYIGSSCLPVLYSGIRLRQQSKAELALVNVDPGILEILKLTRIDALVRVFPTVEDALKAFRDERTH